MLDVTWRYKLGMASTRVSIPPGWLLLSVVVIPAVQRFKIDMAFESVHIGSLRAVLFVNEDQALLHVLLGQMIQDYGWCFLIALLV